MNDSEKDKLIKRDMGSIENVVRHAFNQGYNMGYTDGKETIKALEKESKTGHWIGADGDNAICGCCNRLNHLYGTYCKHCGAKMIEAQEREE